MVSTINLVDDPNFIKINCKNLSLMDLNLDKIKHEYNVRYCFIGIITLRIKKKGLY